MHCLHSCERLNLSKTTMRSVVDPDMGRVNAMSGSGSASRYDASRGDKDKASRNRNTGNGGTQAVDKGSESA